MVSRFKLKIKVGEEERWVDADSVFAHLLKNYTKAELKGKKPEPYADKVNNFFKKIDSEWLDALKKAYPNVEIEQELENAKMWLLSNTSQAKSNFKKFINNWMAKSMRNGKPQQVDGRAKKDVYKPQVFDEELASENEIKNIIQGIKSDLIRRKR